MAKELLKSSDTTAFGDYRKTSFLLILKSDDHKPHSMRIAFHRKGTQWMMILPLCEV